MTELGVFRKWRFRYMRSTSESKQRNLEQCTIANKVGAIECAHPLDHGFRPRCALELHAEKYLLVDSSHHLRTVRELSTCSCGGHSHTVMLEAVAI